MPRVKNYIRSFDQGTIVEYEVTDTTYWVQMVRDTMVSCDDDARYNNWGLVRKFNISTGNGSSYVGRLPEGADKNS